MAAGAAVRAGDAGGVPLAPPLQSPPRKEQRARPPRKTAVGRATLGPPHARVAGGQGKSQELLKHGARRGGTAYSTTRSAAMNSVGGSRPVRAARRANS